jgi:hypothetical protein
LKKEVKDYETKVENLKKEINERNEEINKISKEKKKIEIEHQELKIENDDLNERINNDTRKSDESNEDYEKNISKLKEEIKEMKRKLKSALETEEDVKEVEEKLKESLSQNNSLSKKIKNYENEIENLKDETGKIKEDFSIISETKNLVEKENKKIKILNDELKTRINDLTAQYDETNGEYESKISLYKDETKEIKKKLKYALDVKEESKDLEEKLNDAVSYNNTLIKKIHNYEIEVENLRNENDRTNMLKQKQQFESSLFKSEINLRKDELESKVNGLLKEKYEMSKTILEERNKSLESEILLGHEKEKNKQLTEEISKLHDLIFSLKKAKQENEINKIGYHNNFGKENSGLMDIYQKTFENENDNNTNENYDNIETNYSIPSLFPLSNTEFNRNQNPIQSPTSCSSLLSNFPTIDSPLQSSNASSPVFIFPSESTANFRSKENSSASSQTSIIFNEPYQQQSSGCSQKEINPPSLSRNQFIPNVHRSLSSSLSSNDLQLFQSIPQPLGKAEKNLEPEDYTTKKNYSEYTNMSVDNSSEKNKISSFSFFYFSSDPPPPPPPPPALLHPTSFHSISSSLSSPSSLSSSFSTEYPPTTNNYKDVIENTSSPYYNPPSNLKMEERELISKNIQKYSPSMNTKKTEKNSNVESPEKLQKSPSNQSLSSQKSFSSSNTPFEGIIPVTLEPYAPYSYQKNSLKNNHSSDSLVFLENINSDRNGTQANNPQYHALNNNKLFDKSKKTTERELTNTNENKEVEVDIPYPWKSIYFLLYK